MNVEILNTGRVYGPEGQVLVIAAEGEIAYFYDLTRNLGGFVWLVFSGGFRGHALLQKVMEAYDHPLWFHAGGSIEQDPYRFESSHETLARMKAAVEEFREKVYVAKVGCSKVYTFDAPTDLPYAAAYAHCDYAGEGLIEAFHQATREDDLPYFMGRLNFTKPNVCSGWVACLPSKS